MKASRATIALSILFFFFFSISAFAQDTTLGSQGACGPADVRFDAHTSSPGQPASLEPGKALVYVSEVFKKAPGDITNPTIRIGMDGSWMGATRSNSYIAFEVDPGEHHLCTNWQSHLKRFSRETAFARLTAEAGKTYYFRARINYESAGGQVSAMSLDLEPIDPDEGQYLVVSNPASTSHPQK